MDIQVGDRVTYESFGEIETALITDNEDIDNIKEDIKNNNIEILKIERPKYEVVEEKKELLTEEEKEFWKNICKYYKNISQIFFDINTIKLCNKDFYVVCCLDYPDNINFDNIKKDKHYTLKELGLEEN